MKDNKHKVIGRIEYCPNCKELMERRMHQEVHRTKKMKGYYFQWDYCRKCKYLKHYPQFYVNLMK